MRYIKNWQVDLFAVPITLNHEGREKAKSFHGIFITLLFAGFIIWFIYSLSKQMFSHENPNTITFDTFQEVPDAIELNKESFPFAIGMQLPSTYNLAYFMDEEIYVPVIKLLVFTNTENADGSITKNREIIDIDIEPCTVDHFGSARESVKTLPLSLMYCIKPEQTNLNKIEVSGIEDLTTYKAFYIGIQQCYNTTTKTCKPDAEMADKLTRSWINIIYLQAAINPQNFTSPNQRFVYDYTTMLSPSMLKSGIIRLNHLNVIDDDGWLFENKKTKNFVKADNPIENFDLEPSAAGFIYSGVFELGQVVTTYERQYTKLQTVLAQIQGSAATVILVLIILLRPYSEVKFKETLINELFDVKVKKRDADNANAQINEKKSAKKKKALPGDLKLHKYSSMEESKKAPQAAQGFDLKLSKVPSKEPVKENKFGELLSERPLKETGRENQEDMSLEKGLSPPNMSKAQSFKMLLNSIDNGNMSPEVSAHQMTFEKRALLSQVKGQQDLSLDVSTARKPNKGLTLGIEKPEQAKLAGLSDVITNGPDSPRNVSDISIKEEKQEEKFEGDLQNSSPVMSPQNANEKQDFISIDMGDKCEEDEDMDETQDEDNLNYESAKIDISIWEFFSSYVRKNERTKEKFAVLNKGMESVKDRMDILNIMKKFRELDKLKALLFEEDQLVLFNAMPKAEIKSGETPTETNPELMKSRSFSRRILKKSTFIEINENQEEMRKAYEALQKKAKKSKIDQRLLELYNNMIQNQKKNK